ncbi:MAG: M24 family metallopeptidase [Armatimonadota bacterium]
MTPLEELEAKLARIRALLERRGKSGVLLSSFGPVSWLMPERPTSLSILVTREAHILILQGSSATLPDGELYEQAGFSIAALPWWDLRSLAPEVLHVIPPDQLLSDQFIPGAQPLLREDALALRTPLLSSEVERFRQVGETLGVALTHVMLHCRPGLTEHQLAGMLAGTLTDMGMSGINPAAAADDRTLDWAEPVPTGRRMERYAVVSVAAAQHGMYVSATRSVHFGAPPEELLQRHHACAGIDAALIAATRPGRPLGELLETGIHAYAAAGAPDGWQRYPFGHAIGYELIDALVGPEEVTAVGPPQAFAWSPTLPGVRSHDTMLVTETGHEILTRTPDLPTLTIETPAGPIERPAILVR